ncbi:MAG: hypothetical protein EA397_03455 [Deltaproteobacteria bacterium]|nr:MAG: hypothetical protein EA397_03455 [Deltaproteobacteria bacterium]
MQRWLTGDLSGVDPRSELGLLRDVLGRACREGQPVAPLVHALAVLDPVACADLVAGPRALSEPSVIRAALGVAEHLEPILPASSLYRRFLTLAPSERALVQRAALLRHPEAVWAWTLRPGERPQGASALELALSDEGETAYGKAVALGLFEAVAHRAGAGEQGALRALADGGEPSVLGAALAGWLDAGHPGPVVAWIAAWWGPQIEPILLEAARLIQSDSSLQRLIVESHATEALQRSLTAQRGSDSPPSAR